LDVALSVDDTKAPKASSTTLQTTITAHGGAMPTRSSNITGEWPGLLRDNTQKKEAKKQNETVDKFVDLVEVQSKRQVRFAHAVTTSRVDATSLSAVTTGSERCGDGTLRAVTHRSDNRARSWLSAFAAQATN